MAPPPSSPPPFAFTPLTVGNSLLLSNVQRIDPSLVEYARMPPSSDPESTAPGITVTAAPCEARHVGLLLSHRRSCGPTLHTCSPVASFTARMPPGFCESRSETPKYAFSRSTAPPH